MDKFDVVLIIAIGLFAARIIEIVKNIKRGR